MEIRVYVVVKADAPLDGVLADDDWAWYFADRENPQPPEGWRVGRFVGELRTDQSASWGMQ